MTRPSRAARPVVAVTRAVLVAGLAGVVAAAGAVVLTPGPARAAEVHGAVNGSFAFTGHGYGHGHGMSQWGADGAAQQGLSSAQILDFYYPGTTATAVPNATVRVAVSGLAGGVSATPTNRSGALVAARGDQAGTLALPTSVGGQAVAGWSVTSTGTNGTQTLLALYGGAWHPYQWATTSWIGLAGANGVVSVSRTDGTVRDYRGTVALQSSGGLLAVDRVPLESYLRSVTPSESPSSWPAAALQSQAVAARTYTMAVSNPSRSYDICDNTACQMYSGVAGYTTSGSLIRSYEYASSDSAVAATAGLIRTSGGAPILAQYSSSNGGWSTDGGKPYLVAKADPYDGAVQNGAHSWTATLSAATVGAAEGVGTATSITVNGRDGNGDWGGRTTSVTVTGTSGSKTVTGTAFAGALGLRSEWWTLPTGPVDVGTTGTDLVALRPSGSGSGHLDLHVLSAASGYQTYTQHVATAIGQVPPANWAFALAPYGGDGADDLYALCLHGCGSGHLEVHVLSQASNYQSFLTHVATAQPEVPAANDPQLRVASYAGDGQADLFLVLDRGTGSGTTEVHVLSGASGWQSYLTHRATAAAVTPTGAHRTYLVGPGGDLDMVQDAGTTGSGRTEVHVLTAASGYQTYALHAATGLGLGTGATFVLGPAGTGRPDLYVLLPNGGSGKAEVHVLSGSSGYASFALHTATPLVATPVSDWSLTLG